MKSKGLKVTEFKVFPHFRSPQHHEDKLQPNKEDAETNSKGTYNAFLKKDVSFFRVILFLHRRKQ